ncbi:MAG TPA: hypothetical protein VMR18_01725 [Candidatus Saccharimonadales bacterium]|nr:hypothetical protein [Candidatus Saccharimonadales bacterium]
MAYEDIKPKVGKGAGKRVALKELDSYHTSTLLGHLVNRHKFGLLITFTTTYVAFSLFGRLIVGLIESIK